MKKTIEPKVGFRAGKAPDKFTSDRYFLNENSLCGSNAHSAVYGCIGMEVRARARPQSAPARRKREPDEEKPPPFRPTSRPKKVLMILVLLHDLCLD